MSAAIEWGAPPPPASGGRHNTRALDFVNELKTRPGEWAKYPRTMARPSWSIYARTFPGTEWTARKRPDGRYDYYGRWVGES